MKKRPLYAEIADFFVKAINEGRYPVGSFLPTEGELVEKRQISRSTARAALNQLVLLGLVTRHRRLGTKVVAQSPSTEYSPSVTSIDDLVHYDASTSREVLGIYKVVADDTLAARLDGRPGRRWMCVTTLRYDQGQRHRPICVTENYISEEFESIANKIAENSGLIARLISEEFGLTINEIQQSIRATGISGEMAKTLNCKEGDYALETTRQYFDLTMTPMSISISTHPSSRFTYKSSIKRP